MTTVPTTRPAAVAMPPRPGTASIPGAAPAIDPIKLLKKHKWTLIGAAVAGAFLGTIAHFVLQATYPIYRPFLVFRCLPVQNEPGVLTPPIGFRDELDKFMATEVLTLTSDRIIDKTLSDPAFTREAPKWSARFLDNGVLDRDRAARALKWGLSAGVLGESSLIRVSFWYTDKEDATAIVRLIGRTYERDRRQLASGELNDRRDMLDRSIRETREAIANLQTSRARLLQDQNVDSIEQQHSSVTSQIKSIQEYLVQGQAEIEAMVARKRQMEAELESKVGVTYTADLRQRVEQDPNILRLKDEINVLSAELDAALTRLGPEHRTVLQFQSLLAAKRARLEHETERLLRHQFDTQLDSLRNSINSLQAAQNDLQRRLEEQRARATELTQTLAKVRDIETEIERLTESVNKLGNDLKTVEILNLNQSRIQLVQDAQVPKTMSFPKIYIMIPLGIVLALTCVGGVIVLFELVDQRVKGPSDIALIPRTRILGLVPHAAEDPSAPQKVETVFRDHPDGVLAESYRQLRATLLKRMREDGLKSLLIMSGMPGSGATSVATNLAFSLASADLRVLLIDANLRRPAVHRVLGLAELPGLSDILAGAKTLSDAVQQTENPRVHVLSAGSPSNRVVERLSTEPMGDLLRSATETYDIVLVDVAPAQIAGDGLSLAHRCDATMLVVRAFGEKRGMVARLRNELSEAKAEFLGVVVNAARSLAGGYLKGNILAAHQYQNGKTGKD